MFKESTDSTEPDMFSNIYEHLDGRRKKRLDAPNAWHNIFFRHITSQIEEKPFALLYANNNGAPNASIRLLVAMMILKEGFGWSDEELYDQVEFNLWMMCCLGLNNISDEVPCMATYYNFKKAVYEQQLETGADLIGEVFERLTRKQAKLFGVNGKFARMDSKLIGSNIARCTRLQLILSVAGVFYKDISANGLAAGLSGEDKQRLDGWSKKTPGQIVYTLSNEEKGKLLEELGYLLMRLQAGFTDDSSSKYRLIVRVLAEQYSIEGERVGLRAGKEIKSDSLQSPYDEDAAYRSKKEQKVQGYSVNITETCNEEGLNLVTNVDVEKANVADNAFLQGAISESQKIVGHIENVNTDGAYHSQENQKFTEENTTRFILGGLQGRENNYDFSITSKEEVEVINKTTGEIHRAVRHKDDGYKIKENNKWRYFTAAVLACCLLRKQIEQMPQSERDRRNNVEATVFQLSYFTRNNKTRYRGLFKHQSWAHSRCMWMNFVRIKNYVKSVAELRPDGNDKQNNQGILSKAAEIFILLPWTQRVLTHKLTFLIRHSAQFFLRGEKLLID